jgi:diguanylate cyclase (GGDEF)-like protein
VFDTKSQPKRLLALIDYFANPKLLENSDVLRRARILIAVHLFLIGELTLICLLLPFAFSARSLSIAESICTLELLGFIILLRYLRSSGNYRFCANAAVLLISSPLIVGICVSGGVLHSPVTQLLLLVPLMSFFFGGSRGGSYATALTLFALLVLAVMDVKGIAAIQTGDPRQSGITMLLITCLALMVTAGMAFVYEYTAGELQRERDDEHQRYILLAKTDPLTGLENRRHFDVIVNRRVQAFRALEPMPRFTLCFIDLDGFKAINDSHGHNVGDEVLRVISDRLRSASRSADVVGRHGGDEFMLMLDAMVDRAILDALAQRLINSIKQPISTSVGMVEVSASIGFAQFPDDANELEALKKAADVAMYEAKRRRVGWVFYHRELAT